MADDNKKDGVATAVAFGAAAVATAATTALAPPVAVTVAAAGAANAAAGVFNRVVAMCRHRQTRRTEAMLESAGIEIRGGISGEQLMEFLEQNAKEEWSERTVYETMRSLNEALDDAVVPALGRLLGKYVAGGQTPDRFFRGCSRFLAELSASEFLALQQLVEAVLHVASWADHDQREIEIQTDTEGWIGFIVVGILGDKEINDSTKRVVSIPDALEVSRSMKNHQLASDGHIRSGLTLGGIHLASIEIRMAKRLHAIIGAPSVSAEHKERTVIDDSFG